MCSQIVKTETSWRLKRFWEGPVRQSSKRKQNSACNLRLLGCTYGLGFVCAVLTVKAGFLLPPLTVKCVSQVPTVKML